jgi:hypothetical protein
VEGFGPGLQKESERQISQEQSEETNPKQSPIKTSHKLQLSRPCAKQAERTISDLWIT